MATEHFNFALRAPASSRPYPMAKPGYGKRTMPGQLPRSADDFALLPARERYIAGFIDHLPDGASMDVKSLAKQLPLYGQQAVGSALRALATAGHLRRVRCLVGESGQVRWVSRTFWSRTARDNEWWAAIEVTPAAPAAPPAPVLPAAIAEVPAPVFPATPATPPTPVSPA
ncbi:MAG TPA: MarR family transcriptional regulator, partial [Streptomyces sp.]|nr:MarR family transcriptional regulator [Streptomyces sp.]